MIFTSIVSLIATIFLLVFSFLPDVYSLPTIFGLDIDSALVDGMETTRRFFQLVWPLTYLFGGFIIIAGYFGVKQIVKLIIGSRTPTA